MSTLRWEERERIGGKRLTLVAGALPAALFEVVWRGGPDKPWGLHGYLPGYSGSRASWRFASEADARAAAERLVSRFLALINGPGGEGE